MGVVGLEKRWSGPSCVMTLAQPSILSGAREP
jgi:hypothetical protein